MLRFITIYVEGQTEETFVKNVLNPYLETRELFLTPVLAKTKREKSGQSFKGGLSSYAKVKREIERLLHDTMPIAVTTMLDFYGLPEDFPGKATLPSGSPYQRVAHVEQAFAQDIAHPRFIPFLMLHEFEALLLVAPEEIEAAFPGLHQRSLLSREIRHFSTPEEIDEGPDTHPSARIKRHIPRYQKPVYGPLIANRIGLARIRQRCPHFNAWLDHLERL